MHLVKCSFAEKRPNPTGGARRARVEIEVHQSAAGLLISFIESADLIEERAAHDETVRLRRWLRESAFCLRTCRRNIKEPVAIFPPARLLEHMRLNVLVVTFRYAFRLPLGTEVP